MSTKAGLQLAVRCYKNKARHFQISADNYLKSLPNSWPMWAVDSNCTWHCLEAGYKTWLRRKACRLSVLGTQGQWLSQSKSMVGLEGCGDARVLRKLSVVGSTHS
jgi:hypothetical protein